MEAKGKHAIKITKVKGHATEEMVVAGKVLKQDKEGNDASDEAADRGVEQHGNDLLELSNYLAETQADYGTFVEQIHGYIVNFMMEIDRPR